MSLLSINREKVVSSHIVAIGYDEKEKTLVVEFEMAIWAYSPISKQTYKALMGASSIGSYFHKNIKSDEGLTKERLH